MKRITDKAVCIRHWDFSETSQTVSLFGREQGLIRGLAKGAKREKGNFSGGIELLSRGEVQAIIKPDREVATLTDWDLLEVFPALTRNLKAHYAGLYFADLVQHFLTDHDPHPNLFDLFVDMLRHIGEPGSVTVDGCTLAFQWVILVEMGYQPVLDGDAVTGETLPHKAKTLAFSPSAGGVVTDTGNQDRWRVRRTTINMIRRLEESLRPVDETQTDLSNRIDHWIESIKGTESPTIERANRLLAAYIRTILDRELLTMRTVFGDLSV